MKPPLSHTSALSAEEAFYEAMQAGDVAAIMALWADDDGAVCVHPSGARLVGVAAIRASFEAMLADGGVDVRPSQVSAHQGVLMAVHNLVEKVLVSGGGGSEVIECVATNVYVKSAGGWRILMHHASQLGESAGAELETAHATLH